MCFAQNDFWALLTLFFMKKDKATLGQLSVHEKVKQTA